MAPLDQSTITLLGGVAAFVIGAIATAAVKVIQAIANWKLALATIARKQDENTAKLTDIHKDTAEAGKQNATIISQTNGHLSDLTDRLAEQQKHSAALQAALDALLDVLRTQQLVRAVVPAVVAVPPLPREVRAGDKVDPAKKDTP